MDNNKHAPKIPIWLPAVLVVVAVLAIFLHGPVELSWLLLIAAAITGLMMRRQL
jgi:hypothetical protein